MLINPYHLIYPGGLLRVPLPLLPRTLPRLHPLPRENCPIFVRFAATRLSPSKRRGSSIPHFYEVAPSLHYLRIKSCAKFHRVDRDCFVLVSL